MPAVPGKFAFFQVTLIRNLWLAHAYALAGVCVCHCLIRLSKNLCPAPGGTSVRPHFRKRPENKKPGVERRARPSMQDGPARCSTVFLSGIRNQPHLVTSVNRDAAHPHFSGAIGCTSV